MPRAVPMYMHMFTYQALVKGSVSVGLRKVQPTKPYQDRKRAPHFYQEQSSSMRRL